MKDAVDILNERILRLEAERNSAFDAIAKLTTERDRYREVLELAYDMLMNPRHMEYSAMLEAYKKIKEALDENAIRNLVNISAGTDTENGDE